MWSHSAGSLREEPVLHCSEAYCHCPVRSAPEGGKPQLGWVHRLIEPFILLQSNARADEDKKVFIVIVAIQHNFVRGTNRLWTGWVGSLQMLLAFLCRRLAHTVSIYIYIYIVPSYKTYQWHWTRKIFVNGSLINLRRSWGSIEVFKVKVLNNAGCN